MIYLIHYLFSRFGFYGTQCQHSSIGFQDDSFITMAPISDYSSLTIIGYVATLQSNALLLFNPITITQFRSNFNGFVAIEIIDGSIVFSFNFGADRASRVEVNDTKVNTGVWYRFEAKLQSPVSNNVYTKKLNNLSSST